MDKTVVRMLKSTSPRPRTLEVNLFRSQDDPRVLKVSTEKKLQYHEQISSALVTFYIPETEREG